VFVCHFAAMLLSNFDEQKGRERRTKLNQIADITFLFPHRHTQDREKRHNKDWGKSNYLFFSFSFSHTHIFFLFCWCSYFRWKIEANLIQLFAQHCTYNSLSNWTKYMFVYSKYFRAWRLPQGKCTRRQQMAVQSTCSTLK
jgi:hypothetical protein